MRLAENIKELRVPKGRVALFYLGQAGFCLKTAGQETLVIDAYLSDACERLFRFKRMIPRVLDAEELDGVLCISTHSHADHLDPDALPVMARNRTTRFIGSPDCEAVYRENGISAERYAILRPGESRAFNNLSIKAVHADHGDLCPDAMGVLVDIGGIRIYHAGDTGFAPERIEPSLNSPVDIMIAPINGRYGNMTAREACRLAGILKPRILIACHFWMFLEHVGEGGVGDPATFVRECAALPSGTTAKVMAPGEFFVFPEQVD